MNLGEIIRQRRESLGLTQDQVAVRADISKPYLSNIETGRAKNPPTDGVLEALERALDLESGQLLHIANLLRTPMDIRKELEQRTLLIRKLRRLVHDLGDDTGRDTAGQLDLDDLARQLGDEEERDISTGSAVPIINSVAAGYPQDFTDLDYPPSIADEYVRCPDVSDPQAFAARVVGDSMQPKYHQGDVVVFSPNTAANNGDDCFIRFQPGEGTTFKRFYQDDERTIRLQPLNAEYPAQVHRPEDITGLWPAIFRIENLRRR